MAWFPDLGTTTMVASGAHIRAVGWLSDKHPFPHGAPGADVVARLKEWVSLHRTTDSSVLWQEMYWMGGHQCELCDTGLSSNDCIAVPANGALFVAPDMVVHYIEAHHYSPPVEFINALMNAPLPGTPEYEAAVLALFDEDHARKVAETRRSINDFRTRTSRTPDDIKSPSRLVVLGWIVAVVAYAALRFLQG